MAKTEGQRMAEARRRGKRSASKAGGKFVSKGLPNRGKFPAEWKRRNDG